MNPSASRTARARNLILTAMLAGLLSSCAVAPSSGTEESAAPQTAAASAEPAAVETDGTAESAEPVDSEVVHSTELSIGDCIVDETTGEEIGDVEVVPCEQPHTGEVYAAKDMEPGAYPGDEEVRAAAEEFCPTEFEGFVGIDYNISEIYISYLTPSSKGWTLGGDREIVCFLTSADGSPTTGSLKNAMR